MQILDRVAHLLLPVVERIVKSHVWEVQASVLPRATTRGRLYAVPKDKNRAAGSKRREPETTMTRAARERAERALSAIRALQIAGLWPLG